MLKYFVLTTLFLSSFLSAHDRVLKENQPYVYPGDILDIRVQNFYHDQHLWILFSRDDGSWSVMHSPKCYCDFDYWIGLEQI